MERRMVYMVARRATLRDAPMPSTGIAIVVRYYVRLYLTQYKELRDDIIIIWYNINSTVLSRNSWQNGDSLLAVLLSVFAERKESRHESLVIVEAYLPLITTHSRIMVLIVQQ